MSNAEQDEGSEVTIGYGNMEINSDLDIGELLGLFLNYLFLPLYSNYLGGQ